MSENRTIDGSGNNLQHPNWGKGGEPLLRNTTPAYEGSTGPSGSNRPNPRQISNTVCAQKGTVENDEGLSDYMWAWGQFLDHEIDLTPETKPEEEFNIPPLGKAKGIGFKRSKYDRSTGTGLGNPRQQVNVLSSFIDAANVYGTNSARAAVLRKFDGSGKLNLGDKDFLPKNPGGLPNAPNASTDFFIAGDIRANEHVVLTCLHTLFVREHNQICDKLVSDRRFKKASGEDIYQHARKIVGGLMQAITYEEFLPALLGKDALIPYAGYNPHTNPTICNVFSTACYRLGHSMLSPLVQRVNSKGTLLKPLLFQDTYFKPKVVTKNGIDVFLAGAATQKMQKIDVKAADAIRRFLFKDLPNPPMDLVALNIQRGRDHGLPDYNQCRVDYGLPRKNDFKDISSDPETQKRLDKAYGSVDLIDPWIGGLAEDKHADSVVGELFFHVLKDQFERLRDGDRFWFENDLALSDREINAIRRTKLSDVIKRNTGIVNIQRDVFRAAKPKKK